MTENQWLCSQNLHGVLTLCPDELAWRKAAYLLQFLSDEFSPSDVAMINDFVRFAEGDYNEMYGSEISGDINYGLMLIAYLSGNPIRNSREILLHALRVGHDLNPEKCLAGIRELFNPWMLIFNNTWRDYTVPKIAERIYQEKTLHDLPILADALEESGVTHRRTLEHLRNICELCHGIGTDLTSDLLKCPLCKGTGYNQHKHSRSCWALASCMGAVCLHL